MIVVEEASPYINNLLNKEPWRAISSESDELCPGDVTWDGGAHWHCLLCGRIGKSTFLTHSPPKRVMAAIRFLRRARRLFTRA